MGTKNYILKENWQKNIVPVYFSKKLKMVKK
jgi:hypothetical protein